MRKRSLGLLLGMLLLSTVAGCRVIAGAAALVGEAVIDAAIGDDDDGCDGDSPRHERRAASPNPHRRAAPTADPCR